MLRKIIVFFATRIIKISKLPLFTSTKMTESDSQRENATAQIKLYSSRAITGATFIGGPLAAGYMISENFNALDRPKEGRISLVIAILASIVLFGGLFMFSEKTVDKLPGYLIPLIYIGIITGIVQWKQGDILKAHKVNGNRFFSGWRTVGIGLISNMGGKY